MVGRAIQVSVHKPARMTFFLPVFSIAATKFLSSHEFIEERSMGSCSGKTALSCGHMFPLKLFVSTVVNTTGTSKMRVALARATVLLMIDCLSKFEVPNSIWGMMVDERHDTVIRCQESFFASLRATANLRHKFSFLSFLK